MINVTEAFMTVVSNPAFRLDWAAWRADSHIARHGAR